MTVMEPPKQTKKLNPISLVELQLQVENHLDLEMAAREICRKEGWDTALRDREVRGWELVAEILYTIALDKERYRDFAIDVRKKYGRWVHPNDRGAPRAVAEPEATEE